MPLDELLTNHSITVTFAGGRGLNIKVNTERCIVIPCYLNLALAKDLVLTKAEMYKSMSYDTNFTSIMPALLGNGNLFPYPEKWIRR